MRSWKLIRENWYFEPVILEERSGAERLLGRGGKGRVKCVSDFVSREHCRIRFNNGVFYVVDLWSTNGTFLNGEKLEPEIERELRDGDLIGLGVATIESCVTDEYFVLKFVKVESENLHPTTEQTPENATPLRAKKKPKLIASVRPKFRLASSSDAENSESDDSGHKPVINIKKEGKSKSPIKLELKTSNCEEEKGNISPNFIFPDSPSQVSVNSNSSTSKLSAKTASTDRREESTSSPSTKSTPGPTPSKLLRESSPLVSPVEISKPGPKSSKPQPLDSKSKSSNPDSLHSKPESEPVKTISLVTKPKPGPKSYKAKFSLIKPETPSSETLTKLPNKKSEPNLPKPESSNVKSELTQSEPTPVSPKKSSKPGPKSWKSGYLSLKLEHSTKNAESSSENTSLKIKSPICQAEPVQSKFGTLCSSAKLQTTSDIESHSSSSDFKPVVPSSNSSSTLTIGIHKNSSESDDVLSVNGDSSDEDIKPPTSNSSLPFKIPEEKKDQSSTSLFDKIKSKLENIPMCSSSSSCSSQGSSTSKLFVQVAKKLEVITISSSSSDEDSNDEVSISSFWGGRKVTDQNQKEDRTVLKEGVKILKPELMDTAPTRLGSPFSVPKVSADSLSRLKTLAQELKKDYDGGKFRAQAEPPRKKRLFENSSESLSSEPISKKIRSISPSPSTLHKNHIQGKVDSNLTKCRVAPSATMIRNPISLSSRHSTISKPGISSLPGKKYNLLDSVLNSAKMRVSNKTTKERRTIQLNYAPGSKQVGGKPLLPLYRPDTISVEPHPLLPNPLCLYREEKLNNSARNIQEKQHEGPTGSSTFSKPTSNVPIESVERRVERIPAVNPANMPVFQIMRDMDKADVVVDDVKKKPERPRLNMEYYRNKLVKPNYLRNPREIKPYHASEAKRRVDLIGATVEDIAGIIPQEEVYQDILQWNPSWMSEQKDMLHGELPPLTGTRKAISNLPGFVDYESYINTFYPLMLLELWASLCQDIDKPSRTKTFMRCGGICEFPVLVERLDINDFCPMVSSAERAINKMTPSTTKGKKIWHSFRLITFTESKNLDKNNDLGTLEIDLLKKGVVGKSCKFGFFVTDSDVYEEINSLMDEQKKQFPQNLKYKYKYSVTFVAYLSDHNTLVPPGMGLARKFSYIAPKLREFRAISLLPNSPLFSLIIHPKAPDSKDVYQPAAAVEVAGLVKDVVQLLNPVQKGVVHHISTRLLTQDEPSLFLIHGPPGTGKTRTIQGLVLQLLKANQVKDALKQKLLICTPSNTAIDEIIRRLSGSLEDRFQLVRIGQGCEDVKQFQLEEQAKKHCEGAGQTKSIMAAIEHVKSSIAKLQKDLKEAGDVTKGSILNEIAECQNKKKRYQDDLAGMASSRKAIERAKKDVLLRADIVCSTLSSCSNAFVRKHLGPLKTDKNSPSVFTCCIIDEATQTTEPECLLPLMLNCDRMVLVGDPMQLPATVLSKEAASKDFGQSLFTRLFKFYETQDVSPVMMLTLQYRMTKEILHWPNLRFYHNKLSTHSSVEPDPARRYGLQPYIFFNINSKESNDNRQFGNTEEVKLIKEILLIIKRQRETNGAQKKMSIGVITPYNKQRIQLLKLVDDLKTLEENESTKFSSSIEIDTVDSFQGREKDIIIISCVRTEELGFLKTPQRLNVSLTRAKFCLYIIGNAACLNTNEMWKSLMDDSASRGLYKTIPDFDSTQADKCKMTVEKFLVPIPDVDYRDKK